MKHVEEITGLQPAVGNVSLRNFNETVPHNYVKARQSDQRRGNSLTQCHIKFLNGHKNLLCNEEGLGAGS